jgi:ethanolamine utilization protein EutN
MKLGRIVGSVMCTVKDPGLEGARLLLLQPVDEGGRAYGDPLIACNAVQAARATGAVGGGRGRPWPTRLRQPADAVIGIVDRVDA